MKVYLGLTLLSALAGCSQSASDAVAPIPAVLWSSEKGLLAGKNQYVGLKEGGVAQSELTTVLDGLCGESSSTDLSSSSLKSLFAPEPVRPSVVAVFIASSLSSGDLSKGTGAYGVEKASKGLRNAFQNAPSSAVIPETFVDTKGGVQTPWSRWFFKYQSKVRFNAGSDDLETFGKELQQAIEDKAQKEDCTAVLVNVEGDMDQWDVAVDQVSAQLEQVAPGKVLQVFTGLSHNAAPLMTVDATSEMEEPQLSTLARVLASSNSTTQVTVTSVSPAIFLGLLYGFIFFMTIFVYLYCMDSVQAPTRFAKAYPPMNKVDD